MVAVVALSAGATTAIKKQITASFTFFLFCH